MLVATTIWVTKTNTKSKTVFIHLKFANVRAIMLWHSVDFRFNVGIGVHILGGGHNIITLYRESIVASLFDFSTTSPAHCTLYKRSIFYHHPIHLEWWEIWELDITCWFRFSLQAVFLKHMICLSPRTSLGFLLVWDDPKLLGDSGEVPIFEWSGWRFDFCSGIFALLDGNEGFRV